MAALKNQFHGSTTSAGVLAYRNGARGLEILLVRPGGPVLARQNAQVELLDRLSAIAAESNIE